MFPRHLHAFAQTDVVIPGARKLGTHARLRIDQALQSARNLQRDLFFLGPVTTTTGAGVFPAVARIDRDDHITRPLDIAGGFGHPRFAFISKWIQIHHQSVTVTGIRLQLEGLGAHRLFEIQHHAQRPVRPHRPTHTGQMLVGDPLVREAVGDLGVGKVDHQPVGRTQ